MKGKLLIFSAPSGSGKTTIVKHLLGQNPGLEFSISATSRKKRDSETEGKDYYFLSPDEFRARIEKNEFIEWEEVYEDQFYGTLKTEVERIRNTGKHVVFDVDVVGGLNIKKLYGNDALAVFVKAPSVKILEERLRARSSDDEVSLQKRISKALSEMNYAEKFDIILINDKLEEALAQASTIVSEFLKRN